MNAAQKQAIQNEISYLEDNMYRYKMQQQAAGSYPDIARTIAEHERKIAELKEGM